jgi:polysaccharide biosynthesis protein PslL
MTGSKTRVKHIDIAKGISIFLVVLYHSDVKDLFPALVDPMSLFRMPLFFMLSGVFFSYKDNFSDFCKKKLNALIKPYLIILISLYLLTELLGMGSDKWPFWGIFYGNGDIIRWSPMWFLTHLFALYISAYLLFKFTKLFDTNRYFSYMILALM